MSHIQAEAFTSCKKNRLQIRQMHDLSRSRLNSVSGGGTSQPRLPAPSHEIHVIDYNSFFSRT
jgi:hypothetical protein